LAQYILGKAIGFAWLNSRNLTKIPSIKRYSRYSD
jgi:hypothetical protein